MKKKTTKTKSESKAKESLPKQTRCIKTRCNNEWTEAKFRSFVISALRAKSRYWKPIPETKKRARVSRGKYRCEICKRLFNTDDIVVDHIVPIVGINGFTTFDDFIYNLFCEKENLQAICKDCHKIKTNEENQLRKSKRYS